MNYVVTYWNGDVRSHLARKDLQSAEETAVTLRKRSDTFVNHSLVPIRVMEESVWTRMQSLEKARDTTGCKHGVLRLCLICLSSGT